MKRSKFSLSHYRLLSTAMGRLTPVGCFEVLPGDTIQHSTSLLMRFAPLVSPPLHPTHVRIHHVYVPYRLVWNDFQSFITGGETGADASTFPTINLGTVAEKSLADYLGVPTGVANTTVSALPFRAYALIYNELFRDQDLQTALTIDKTDGADTTTSVDIQNVCWEKDYFTTSRPDPFKGPDITLPLGDRANIRGIGKYNATHSSTPVNVVETGGATVAYNKSQLITDASDNQKYYAQGNAAGDAPDIYADLSTATAASINELRDALARMRFEEARMRWGGRYVEYLRYLGIRPSDARLQRPEILGSGRQTCQFSEVLQTGVTTSGTPSTGVGSMLGHGIAAVRSNRYRRFFEEHGVVISLLSVLPKTMYMNGLPRMWVKTTKEDFYQRELERVGQQEVLNKEVYLAHSAPAGVFGYQDKYDEYRRQESGVSGEFRSTLNYWHLARSFGSDPALNSTFVGANPATRIFQSTATDGLYAMASHSIQARRMLTANPTPQLR